MSTETPKKAAPDEQEEIAHLDDRVVGRAFKWSAVAVVVLAGAITAGIIYARRAKPKAVPQKTALTTPVARVDQSGPLPKVKFTDITAAARISFDHHSGASWNKLLPETMGAGVAFLDFDNDGDQDLLFINGKPWPWQRVDASPSPLTLYANDSTGKFNDVTRGSGLDVTVMGMGVAVGDFDNDGLADVFVTCVGTNHLFKNLGGGKFSDVTTSAGVGGDGQWSTAACFFDYDNDGRLDLFLPSWWAEGRSLLLRNETPGGNWLRVKVGPADGVNRMGVGARVRVYEAGKLGDPAALLGCRDVAVGYGYASGQPGYVHFGLGGRERVDVDVVLPHGKGTLAHRGAAANQLVTVGR